MMVAKGATRAGEFFCFHCGRQVDRDDQVCRGCGLGFHKMMMAFRCPRCAKILPSGAVICPACGLGFKIKNVAATKDMTKDEEMLVELIDWGKQPGVPASDPLPDTANDAVCSEAPPLDLPMERQAEPEGTTENRDADEALRQDAVKTDETALPLSPEVRSGQDGGESAHHAVDPDSEGVGGIFIKIDEAGTDLLSTVDRNKKLLDQVKGEGGGPEGSGTRSPADINLMYDRLLSGINDIERLDSKINQLAVEVKAALSKGDSSEHAVRQPIPSQPVTSEVSRGSLSNLALRKLLEERESEVRQLKEREAEISRREEHINRMVREYVSKKKELEMLRRSASAGTIGASEHVRSADGAMGTSDFPEQLVVDDKEEWLREQSRIKSGLIEIRNEMEAKNEALGYYPSHISGDVMEKIEVLEERLIDATRERDELSARLRSTEERMSEVKAMFIVLDQLLGKLPPGAIDEFSKSKEFRLYEKILDELKI